MTTTAGLIAPEVFAALEQIEVTPGGLTALVGEEKLAAESPGDLVRQLGSTLYQTLHAAMPEQTKARKRSLRDPEFEERFAAAMPHRGSLVRAELVDARVRPGDGVVPDTVIADVDGIRVRVPTTAVVEQPPGGAEGPAVLRLPAARPALSPGFFLADSSRGRSRGPQVLRVYLHLTDAESAPDVWGAVLTRLEGLGVRYRAKVTSGTRLFPRRDGLVVYLGPDAWYAVDQLVASVEGLPGLGTETSPFVRRLADGVGAAWEPDDPRPGKRGLSFGEHRCQAVAEALVGLAVRADGEGSREAAVAEAFFNAGVDPLMPARNLGSPVVPGIAPV
ncbi:T3SS effector HopA1 family protein [Streptomyces sp. NBC_00287]|uniref:T3SS effector HopA1 family protein n=1 Tax=Streptomyces sp. NBC_00287 TaxID=2975702 RepID=UPI002E29BEA2|nr:T3SS effector HopA1 family protein [Streptomyces sp. NBC_00287]